MFFYPERDFLTNRKDNDDSHPCDPNALPICGKDTGSPCDSYAQELLMIMTRVLFVLSALVLLGAAHSQQQSPHTTYYIAAGGNNANDGLTPATAWADETNISRRVFRGQTTIAFNGTDTFTGCIHAKGSVNFRSTRTSMIRLTSYGNGLATLKPNCTAASAKIGIINVDRVDGLIIDRLHLIGDPAGKAGRCSASRIPTAPITEISGLSGQLSRIAMMASTATTAA